jgi:hypothetical protein
MAYYSLEELVNLKKSADVHHQNSVQELQSLEFASKISIITEAVLEAPADKLTLLPTADTASSSSQPDPTSSLGSEDFFDLLNMGLMIRQQIESMARPNQTEAHLILLSLACHADMYNQFEFLKIFLANTQVMALATNLARHTPAEQRKDMFGKVRNLFKGLELVQKLGEALSVMDWLRTLTGENPLQALKTKTNNGVLIRFSHLISHHLDGKAESIAEKLAKNDSSLPDITSELCRLGQLVDHQFISIYQAIENIITRSYDYTENSEEFEEYEDSEEYEEGEEFEEYEDSEEPEESEEIEEDSYQSNEQENGDGIAPPSNEEALPPASDSDKENRDQTESEEAIGPAEASQQTTPSYAATYQRFGLLATLQQGTEDILGVLGFKIP